MERLYPRAGTLLIGDAGAETGTGARSRNDDGQRGLTGIKGDVCLMQDSSGRFVQAYVDKNTQREPLVVSGCGLKFNCRQISPGDFDEAAG